MKNFFECLFVVIEATAIITFALGGFGLYLFITFGPWYPPNQWDIPYVAVKLFWTGAWLWGGCDLLRHVYTAKEEKVITDEEAKQ